MPNIPGFDLIEWQQMAREMIKPEELFKFWEKINKMYLSNQIGRYELDELKDVIFERLAQLNNIKKEVNKDVP